MKTEDRESLAGRKVGRLTVLDKYRIKVEDKRSRGQWKCMCDCGATTWVRSNALKKETTKSCGCGKGKGHRIERGLSSKNRLFRRYGSDARRRNLEFDLSFEEFIRLTISDCYYCGSAPASIQKADGNNGDFIFNGIDRCCSDEGYSAGNCVTCCQKCNFMKGKLNREEFRQQLKKAYEHQFNKGGEVKKHRVLIGRWQPPHKSHQWLAQEASNNWKDPLIIFVRDIPPDDKNPFTTEQTMNMLRKVFEGKDVTVSTILDISGVHYGRGVGYDIVEHEPPEDIERVSATSIREGIKSNDDAWKEVVDASIHEMVVEYLNENEDQSPSDVGSA